MVIERDKIYSVSIPVHAAVVVYVKAPNADLAEELAGEVAHIQNAEIIDVNIAVPADVMEVDYDDVTSDSKIWTSRNKYEFKG